jgi:hypothetical protein
VREYDGEAARAETWTGRADWECLYGMRPVGKAVSWDELDKKCTAYVHRRRVSCVRLYSPIQAVYGGSYVRMYPVGKVYSCLRRRNDREEAILKIPPTGKL